MAIPSAVTRLSERVGVDGGGRRLGGTTLRRLVGYYTVVLAVIAGLVWVSSRPLPAFAGKGALAAAAADSPPLHPLRLLVDGAAAVAGAFLLAAPLAFVYVRTRSRLTYDRNLVQTVIMLPVVVTCILIVVQNSLALAFSLAGIMAAVRFKNTLEDSRDAVYILAAVGIGFAAGVRQLAVAAFLSLIFTTLELLLWKFDLAADHAQTFGLLCEPAEGGHAGHHPGAGALPPAGASPSPGDPARGEILRVYLTASPAGRAAVERVLGRATRKWRLQAQRSGGVDQLVLDYELRLERGVDAQRVIERLYAEGDPDLLAAEVVAP